MSGWKTKLGAGLVAIGGILGPVGKAIGGDLGEGVGQLGVALVTIGGALAAVGIGHKIDKAGPQ